MNSDPNSHYDVIIIGSGIGGLTTASLLAQMENKRVLILERHFKLGGFTHTFSRKGQYEWDVGLHYVGEMAVGQPTRAIFDFITQGKVDWQAMPEVYDRFIFPDFRFDIREGIEAQKADLVKTFPEEATAIQQYFKDLDKAHGWLGKYTVTQAFKKWARPVIRLARWFGATLALRSTGDYIDTLFRNEKLKAVLLGQWGLYGLPPKSSAFAGHALLVKHYCNGKYYPVGGSAVIAEFIIPVIEAKGGKALTNHGVTEILLEGRKAIGVRVERKKGQESAIEEFFADRIISNAGAHTTYTKLMPHGVRFSFAEKTANFPQGTSNVTLYLGLKDDPARLGFKGENYWIYSSYDHDDNYARRNELVEGNVSHVYVSFPSMKNPKAKGHTAEIIAFMDADPFVDWEDQPWRRRGEDYEALKARIAESLIEFVDNRLNGFRDLIEYRELATFITTEYFTNHRNGNIYGIPMVKEKFTSYWLSPFTPIKNLYLTGADAAIFGIVGAMMGGVLAAAFSQGKAWKIMNIFKQSIIYSTQLHQDKEISKAGANP